MFKSSLINSNIYQLVQKLLRGGSDSVLKKRTWWIIRIYIEYTYCKKKCSCCDWIKPSGSVLIWLQSMLALLYFTHTYMCGIWAFPVTGWINGCQDTRQDNVYWKPDMQDVHITHYSYKQVSHNKNVSTLSMPHDKKDIQIRLQSSGKDKKKCKYNRACKKVKEQVQTLQD